MLLRYFLVEEYRRHVEIAKKRYFLMFPLYVFVFSLFGGFMVEDVFASMGYSEAINSTLIGTMLYGFGVVSFELLGRLRERGQLANFHRLLPISPRMAYLQIFLRDAIYYSVLFILPSSLGLALSTLVSQVSLFGALCFSLSMELSMLIGYSAGYLSFSIRGKSRGAYLAFLAGFFILSSLVFLGVLPFPPARFQITKEPMYALISLLVVLGFTLIAYFLTSGEVEEIASGRGNIYEKLRRFSSPLMAKELTAILRGHIVEKSLLTYFFPMVLLFILIRVIDQSFGGIYNPSSLSVMLSIFSPIIYSWVTIMEDTSHLSLLPLKSADVVKTHVKGYILVVSLVSVPVMLVLHLGNVWLLPKSILLFYVNTIYMGSVMANISGHKVSSMLFNFGVLMKFTLLTTLPGTLLLIGTFDTTPHSSEFLVGLSAMMLLTSAWMIKRAEKKWIYF